MKKLSQYEIMKGIRKDWGTFNPTTRVKNSKKVYKRKPKHSKKDW